MCKAMNSVLSAGKEKKKRLVVAVAGASGVPYSQQHSQIVRTAGGLSGTHQDRAHRAHLTAQHAGEVFTHQHRRTALLNHQHLLPQSFFTD